MKRKIISLCLMLMYFPSIASWAVNAKFNDHKVALDTKQMSIYPETIIVNHKNGHFLAGSVRYGSVYEIDGKGSYRKLIEDERLSSVLGIAVDEKREKIFVTNSDLGVSINSTYQGSLNLAAVGIYDLKNGKNIAYLDLGKLLPGQEHFANGIAIDDEGNAYITDSVSPVIYKVDTKNKSSIFLKSKAFEGKGFNLNGIVYHPDGYLVAIKKNSGELFKIPLNAPESFSRVDIPQKLIGGDGIIFIDKDELVLVSNEESDVSANSAVLLKGMNNWDSASVIDTYELGDVYPTTGVVKDNKIYVMHSSLKKLRNSAPKERPSLNLNTTILEIGSISQ